MKAKKVINEEEISFKAEKQNVEFIKNHRRKYCQKNFNFNFLNL